MKTLRQKAYEKRRNLWRRNVPKRISRGKRVPDWFENFASFRKLFESKKSIPAEPRYLKTSFLNKLINFIKKILHL